MKKVLTSIFILLVFIGCSSTESYLGDTNTDTDDAPESEQSIENALNPEISSYNAYTYQSSLSDTYSRKSNTVPDAFIRLKSDVEDASERNQFEGYRVQIYSGQDVVLADSAAMKFRAWSDTTIVGYQAETYTFFKAPYYRVHVGDFHDRDLANYFSNLLKRRFRDSWVVYDQVDPRKVPSDTTYIYIE